MAFLQRQRKRETETDRDRERQRQTNRQTEREREREVTFFTDHLCWTFYFQYSFATCLFENIHLIFLF